MLKDLLRLQDLDLKIEVCRTRETQIPKQKEKFEIQRKRLTAELEDREKVVRELLLEQRGISTEIEQKQTQIDKYQTQLFQIKKNEEYTALLHEIELLKKQIGLKEERIITLMVEVDEAKARLEEDKKRILLEQQELDRQCAEIDAELAEAQKERRGLEEPRATIAKLIDSSLMSQYTRIRASKKTGPAIVPLRGEVCSGCHMHVTAQMVNEVLAGKKHVCHHCGRILYAGNDNDDENGLHQHRAM
ncbi:MAG: C4-type zinc ribbon domain-containing protein [FCB group bacterium]|nr:C4-type zinc ribbon domain-containing protein [FCB group bacterium]